MDRTRKAQLLQKVRMCMCMLCLCVCVCVCVCVRACVCVCIDYGMCYQGRWVTSTVNELRNCSYSTFEIVLCVEMACLFVFVRIFMHCVFDAHTLLAGN